MPCVRSARTRLRAVREAGRCGHRRADGPHHTNPAWEYLMARRRVRDPWDRFREKFVIDESSGCWLWVAGVDGRGYGRFSVGSTAHWAHRWAFEYLVGPVGDGLVLDHLCRVHSCVNPAHLEPVTCRVNSLRGSGAHMAITGRCGNGHEMTPENTYQEAMRRRCRTCRRERRRRMAARRAAGIPPDAPSRRVRCPQGHLYDEVNTYRASDGRRQCRACRRERDRRRRRDGRESNRTAA